MSDRAETQHVPCLTCADGPTCPAEQHSTCAASDYTACWSPKRPRGPIPSGRPAEASRLTVREAARRRTPIDGSDAQALEGALAQTEGELAGARLHARLTEEALSEARARIDQLEAEAEMATRMLAASGREQARLRTELELCEARALGLELRVAKAAERLPGGHTAHRAASLGRTR